MPRSHAKAAAIRQHLLGISRPPEAMHPFPVRKSTGAECATVVEGDLAIRLTRIRHNASKCRREFRRERLASVTHAHCLPRLHRITS